MHVACVFDVVFSSCVFCAYFCWVFFPDDIEIRFYEEDEHGETKWEGRGEFGIPDVHRQVKVFNICMRTVQKEVKWFS